MINSISNRPLPFLENGGRVVKFQASNHGLVFLVTSPYPEAYQVISLGQKTCLLPRKFQGTQKLQEAISYYVRDISSTDSLPEKRIQVLSAKTTNSMTLLTYTPHLPTQQHQNIILINTQCYLMMIISHDFQLSHGTNQTFPFWIILFSLKLLTVVFVCFFLL